MKSAVRVDRAVKQYDGTNALKGLSFAAGRGEILGFPGLDGTEKTMLMSIFTGIIPLTQVRAEVKGYGTTRRCLETSEEEA